MYLVNYLIELIDFISKLGIKYRFSGSKRYKEFYNEKKYIDS